MSTPKSPTTTKAGVIGGSGGIIAGVILLLQSIDPLLDGDASTVPSWDSIAIAISIILAGFGIGSVGWTARDNNVRSEGTKINCSWIAVIGVIAILFLGGCCTQERVADRAFVTMVDQTNKSIFPEYLAYVDADEELNSEEQRIRRETVEAINRATTLKLAELTSNQ